MLFRSDLAPLMLVFTRGPEYRHAGAIDVTLTSENIGGDVSFGTMTPEQIKEFSESLQLHMAAVP